MNTIKLLIKKVCHSISGKLSNALTRVNALQAPNLGALFFSKNVKGDKKFKPKKNELIFEVIAKALNALF
ncbi:hypothetical protein [Polynucleobacter sp. MWH-Adler-W8]|uniref:hypothetical protein n=1 Tax=Polynucleobacter sp. MWH-Adler-W8 TaxID=1819727 RepID=UPI001300ED26|nr:hypothetical protein [Polynucleobacter sp. MWH-Adler-W8]